MNWTEEQVKQAEQRIQARCHVRKVEHVQPMQSTGKRQYVRVAPTKHARRAPTGKLGSYLEAKFAMQLKATKVKPPVPQYAAIIGREFKVDFCWPDEKVAVLVQGNVHRIKSKFYADCALFCLLTMAGWRYLPVSRNEITSGMAVKWVEQLLLEAS